MRSSSHSPRCSCTRDDQLLEIPCIQPVTCVQIKTVKITNILSRRHLSNPAQDSSLSDLVTKLASISIAEIEAEIDAEAGPEPLELQPRDSSRNTGRPIIFSLDKWQVVSTSCEAARAELPFASISDKERDLAHGNMNNSVAELDEVARLQFIPLPNRPVKSPAVERPQQPAPSRLPRKGHCEDLFDRSLEGETTFEFDHLLHGDWVRSRLIALKGDRRSRMKTWKLTPMEIVAEILFWFETVAKDILAAKQWIKRGKAGRFKPSAKIWIIPILAFAKWARPVVWWVAPYFAATKAERKDIQIHPQNFAIASPSPWDTAQLSRWASQSGMEDLRCMQDLHEDGVFLEFTGSKDSVLAPPAVGMYNQLTVAQETTYDEIKEGWLSDPILGPHTLPVKMSSRNVAITFKSGKMKYRGTANLSSPDKLSLHQHSVNDGYDLTNEKEFPARTFTTPTMIAFLLAIVATACGESFVLCKNDWKSFYRQIRKSQYHWWLQQAMTVTEGCVLDFREIFGACATLYNNPISTTTHTMPSHCERAPRMTLSQYIIQRIALHATGDASACSSANRVEDLLLHVIRFLILEEWGIPEDPTKWFDHVQSLHWMNPTIIEWMNDRADLWGKPSAELSLTDNFEKLWSCIPCIITGFFDDGIYGGHIQVCDSADRAIFKLMSIGVLAQLPKFERGFLDDTVTTRLSETTWAPRTHGWIMVLGKIFKLSSFTKCDSPARIAEAKALLRAILYQAQNNDRLVFESSLRRMLGIMVYITDSCVFLRTYLRGTIKALKASGSWRHNKTPAASADYSWMMAQATYHGAAAYEKGQPEFESWLKSWCSLRLGKTCKLPLICESQFDALISSISTFNEQVFMPRRSPVPIDHVVYLCLDSAGLSKEDPSSIRACGGWAYCSSWSNIRWFQEAWHPSVLEKCHSTIMEAANGLSCLEYAMRNWPALVYMEIYDSGATVDIFRAMASRSFEMRKLLKARFELLCEFPHVRALPFWQARELGYIADCFTKFETTMLRSALKDRFPHLALRAIKEPKPANMINSPAFAAQWTSAEDEAFDS